MFFGTSKPPENTPSAPPPPWENIDTTRQKPVRPKQTLTDVTSTVTGFGKLGAKALLISLAGGFAFVAFIIYANSETPKQSPPEVLRPAIDKFATSTTP